MTRHKLLTEAEVSEWTGVPAATLRTHRHPSRRPANAIPFLKLPNGQVRYREDQVQAWIESASEMTELPTRGAKRRLG